MMVNGQIVEIDSLLGRMIDVAIYDGFRVNPAHTQKAALQEVFQEQ